MKMYINTNKITDKLGNLKTEKSKAKLKWPQNECVGQFLICWLGKDRKSLLS